MELSWKLRLRQLHCDRLYCANALLGGTAGAGGGEAWQQRYAQLVEAERLKMQAVKLNSEVGYWMRCVWKMRGGIMFRWHGGITDAVDI